MSARWYPLRIIILAALTYVGIRWLAPRGLAWVVIVVALLWAVATVLLGSKRRRGASKNVPLKEDDSE